MTNPITLIDGTESNTSSPEYLAQCQMLDRHIANMRRMPLGDRRGYIVELEHSESPAYAAEVVRLYGVDWQLRRDAAAKEKS
jgi:hypothetical protein